MDSSFDLTNAYKRRKIVYMFEQNRSSKIKKTKRFKEFVRKNVCTSSHQFNS